jgi:hypothetical protein
MGRDGPGRLHVRRATAAGQERDSVSKNATESMTPDNSGAISEFLRMPQPSPLKVLAARGRCWTLKTA